MKFIIPSSYHVRKQTITHHLQSNLHDLHTDRSLKRKAETYAGVASKRQATVTECNDRQTAAGISKENLIVDLLGVTCRVTI